MTERAVQFERVDGVARITLDRPAKRNALTRSLLEQLRAAVDEVSRDDDVRLLQLRANGSVFCAGMDLAEMEQRATAEDPRDEWDADTRAYREAVWSLLHLPVPAVAVLQGPVLAGGVGLVMACDLVIASEEAWFSLPEPRRGITAAIVTPVLLLRAGVSAASRLLLSLRRTDADEARRAGLCHDVVPTASLDERVAEWTASILHGSREALRTTKTFLLQCAAEQLERQFEAGTVVSARARETADAREGLAAFLEGRPSAWEPRKT